MRCDATTRLKMRFSKIFGPGGISLFRRHAWEGLTGGSGTTRACRGYLPDQTHQSARSMLRLPCLHLSSKLKSKISAINAIIQPQCLVHINCGGQSDGYPPEMPLIFQPPRIIYVNNPHISTATATREHLYPRRGRSALQRPSVQSTKTKTPSEGQREGPARKEQNLRPPM